MNNTQPHLAHRVRRLADDLATDRAPRSRNRRLAQQLAQLAALLWALDEMPFVRAAEWASTGLVSGGGGTGSTSEPSSPTELAAIVGLDKPDRLAAYDRWLRYYRATLPDLAGPMVKILDDIARRAGVELDHPGTVMIVDPVTGKENRVPQCAEYFCEAGAERPVLGRCDPCRKWRERWLEKHPGASPAECPVVPKDVIEGRAIRRKRQAVA